MQLLHLHEVIDMKRSGYYIILAALIGMIQVQAQAAFLYNGDDGYQSYKTSAIQSFNAVIESQSVRLSWDVHSVEGIQAFEIQRTSLRNGSMSSLTWTTVGTIAISGGSNQEHFEFHDLDAQSAVPVAVYRIRQISENGSAYTSPMKVSLRGEAAFELHSIFPNPATVASTPVVQYRIAAPEHVSIAVFDIAGRMVSMAVDAYHNAGEYSLPLNTASLTTGQYFVRMSSESTTKTQRLTIAR